MKQHITIDQLNELSEKGKEKLKSWWISKHIFPYDGSMCILSIGQLIEFIIDNSGKPYLMLYNAPFNSGTLKWKILTGNNETYPEQFEFNGDEICDILWQKVKQLLKQ